MTLIRISPDGKEVKYLYDDDIYQAMSNHTTIEVTRASDVFFDNEDRVWRIKFLDSNTTLVIPFGSREEALKYERGLLENNLRNHFDEIEECNKQSARKKRQRKRQKKA